MPSEEEYYQQDFTYSEERITTITSPKKSKPMPTEMSLFIFSHTNRWDITYSYKELIDTSTTKLEVPKSLSPYPPHSLIQLDGGSCIWYVNQIRLILDPNHWGAINPVYNLLNTLYQSNLSKSAIWLTQSIKIRRYQKWKFFSSMIVFFYYIYMYTHCIKMDETYWTCSMLWIYLKLEFFIQTDLFSSRVRNMFWVTI